MELASALLLGSGISAGSSLLGGIGSALFGSSEQERNRQWQYNAQKEFYQNSLQWRVNDAKKAGLAPQAAVGGVASYSPTSFASSDSIGSQISSALGKAGSQFGKSMESLALKNAELDAQKKYLDVLQKQQEIDSKNNNELNKINNQGVDVTSNQWLGNQMMPQSDFIDMLSEMLGGVGAIQPAIKAIVDMNTNNPSKFQRDMLSLARIPERDFNKVAYVKTTAGTAGLPKYEFVFKDGVDIARSPIAKKLYTLNEFLGVYDKERSEAMLGYQKLQDQHKFKRNYKNAGEAASAGAAAFTHY